jgi:hypothetical protein
MGNCDSCNSKLSIAQTDLQACKANLSTAQTDVQARTAERDACVTNCEKTKNMFYSRFTPQIGQPVPELCRTVFNTVPAPYWTAFYGPKCVSSAYLQPYESLGMSDNSVCADVQYDGFTYFPCTGPKPDESTVAELVKNNPQYAGLSVL